MQAYTTNNLRVFWASGTRTSGTSVKGYTQPLRDISDSIVGGLDIIGSPNYLSRSIMGKKLDQVITERVDMTVAIPRLLYGADAEALLANNGEGTLFVISTGAWGDTPKSASDGNPNENTAQFCDAEALVMDALVNGIPQNAARRGDITGSFSFMPRGGWWVCRNARPIYKANAATTYNAQPSSGGAYMWILNVKGAQIAAGQFSANDPIIPVGQVFARSGLANKTTPSTAAAADRGGSIPSTTSDREVFILDGGSKSPLARA